MHAICRKYKKAREQLLLSGSIENYKRVSFVIYSSFNNLTGSKYIIPLKLIAVASIITKKISNALNNRCEKLTSIL